MRYYRIFSKEASLAALATAIIATAPSPALAQVAEDQDPARTTNPARPGEIIVTGQKRSATLSETPATAQLVDDSILQTNRVTDIQGLTQIVAGFGFEKSNGGNMTVSMRGIGTASSATSLEVSVSPYIEGVYQGGTQRGFSWPMFDIERVEVFKGTQSGIVGQNTSVGVINILANKPGSDFGGYLTGAYEFKNDGYRMEGAIDLPASDQLSFRIAGFHERIGGWIKNRATGNDLGTQNRTAIRLIGVWEPSDRLNVRLYAEYDKIHQLGSATAIWYGDTTGKYAEYIAPYFDFRSPNGNGKDYSSETAYYEQRFDGDLLDHNGDSHVSADNYRGSITLDYDLGGGYTITSITAGSREHDNLAVDQDITPALPPTSAADFGGQNLTQKGTYHQITEELRLASPSDKPFSFIAGLWYRHAISDKAFTFYRDRFVNGAAVVDVAYQPSYFNTNNYSVFGDVQYKLTDRLTFGGSLRYTHEVKKATISGTSTWPNIFTPFPEDTVKLTPSFFDGSARVQFEPTDNINLYAAYAHGTKTGSVVDLVGSGIFQVLKPEKASTFEAGIKANFFDRILTVDLSAFDMKVKDYQDVQTIVANGVVVFQGTNTDIHIKGVDFDARLRPAQGLQLGINGEYLDGKDETNGGDPLRTPKWSFIADARYTLPFNVGNGAISLFGSVQHKTTYFNQPTGAATRQLTVTPKFTKYNVGIEYEYNDQVNLSLVCRNCTNEFELVRPAVATFGPLVDGVRGSAQYAYVPELRTISLQATYDF